VASSLTHTTFRSRRRSLEIGQLAVPGISLCRALPPRMYPRGVTTGCPFGTTHSSAPHRRSAARLPPDSQASRHCARSAMPRCEHTARVDPQTTRDQGALIVRKLIACVFFYSLDGLLADEDTEYWRFCFGLPDDAAEKEQSLDRYQSAYAHIMGRAAYEAMAAVLPTATDHSVARILNPARKVVFSRTLKTAGWANTTVPRLASGGAAADGPRGC